MSVAVNHCSLRWVSETAGTGAALTSVFNNGRIMIPIGTNGSSFAKRRRPKGANGSENGVQLLCCQRVKFGEKNDLPTIS
jgi:hypothetical protein